MTTLHVRVPATTANLGSGFDCVGMALDFHDELEMELLQSSHALAIEVEGQGAGTVPTDETHLVVSSLLRGLQEWGGERPGMRLRCHNRIPHSRGLGSSASAIVAGLAFAWGISRPGEALDRAELTRVSSFMEGHPDNAGAAVWGGAILGWFDGDDVDLVQLEVPAVIGTLVWVPQFEVGTAGARSVLPEVVPRRDAVAQAIAAAALPLALERRHDLLLAATADRLHQSYRADLMRPSFDLMTALREAGVPATISGAGPTVIAFGTAEQLTAGDAVASDGFERHALALGSGVELTVS
ncbi:homoserine kinase [Tessaracoccus antarcticus]|uniref:Homoserine kinase n=1 Tax=Tessaracoccus antarcticus TaxID=2479848 RepID=A0A3M0G8W4_9ACTN|nr:homoserine kinase [Tessaracoccus antarcticus]RMB58852.1 homoserine kinase [Tessaracoccus antarcticus]